MDCHLIHSKKCLKMICDPWYCSVFIHFYSTSHSMSLSEVLQATVSEGLAQGPNVSARAGFEPAPLRSKGHQRYQFATTPHGSYCCMVSAIIGCVMQVMCMV